MTESSGFEATGRAGLDHAASFGSNVVHTARILPRDGDVEAGAPFAVIGDETERWRALLEHCVFCK